MARVHTATVCVLGWGALAFGAEYSWAYAPLLVMCVTLGIMGLVMPGGDTRSLIDHANPQRPVAIGLLVVLGVAGLQAVPLPRTLVSVASPARFEIDFDALHAVALPRASEVAPAARTPPSTISIWPSRTVLGLAFIVSLGVLLLGATRALSIVRPNDLIRGLIALGVLVAVVGVIQRASESDVVYGFWYPRKSIRPAAPFTNGNHAAGWLVMTLSVSVGYLCGAVSRRARRTPDWRRRLLWIGSSAVNEILLVTMAIGVMAVGVVVTLSRSGIISLVVALAGAGLWANRHHAGRRQRFLIPIALALVLVVAVGRGGLDRVGQEFERASWNDVGRRIPIWRDTTTIIRDFPATGTGLNTYGIAMLAYQKDIADTRAVEAHNDYLQLAAEGGLLLGIPFLWLGWVVTREIRHRFTEEADAHDAQTYWQRVGAVTGLGAIALQETVDFSLQMPGNAALFVVLLAIAMHRPRCPEDEAPQRAEGRVSHSPEAMSRRHARLASGRAET